MSVKKYILILLVFALAGCSSTPTVTSTEQVAVVESTDISVTDGMGTTVELDQPATRIVSLSPSVTEILFAINAGDQLVGREDNSTYPDQALDVTSVGSLYGELPSETILALEPDLVVAGEIINAEQVQALQALGLTVFWQSNPIDFDGLYKNITDLGTLSGHSKQSETLINDLESRVTAVTEKLSGVDDKPKVFYEMDGTDPSNPWTSGSGTFIDYIINMAGGTNVTSDLVNYAQISTEDLITRNPDVILLGDALYGTTPESVAARPGWEVMKAVGSSSIYPIDPFTLSVPGPRLVDGLEEAARLIHPELFVE